MAPKKTAARISKSAYGPRQNTWGSGQLAGYLGEHDAWSASRIVRRTDKFVVIKDKYPKASIHYLILPHQYTTIIPQDAFEDPEFLEECRQELKIVRHMVAEELRRMFGRFSKAEQPRIAAMESEELVEPLPPGRDWDKEVISGIHACPSMSNLHIHVLSRDMFNDCMRTRDHYQSFTTDFFVGLQDFPLAREDVRRPHGLPPVHRALHVVYPGKSSQAWRGLCRFHYSKGAVFIDPRGTYCGVYLTLLNQWRDLNEMVCWRCGAKFGRKFADLKRHLVLELDEWIRE